MVESLVVGHEPEAETERRRLRDGIPVSRTLLGLVNEIASGLGLAPLAQHLALPAMPGGGSGGTTRAAIVSERPDWAPSGWGARGPAGRETGPPGPHLTPVYARETARPR